MRILCDVHIPLRMVRYFSECGVEAMHVNHLPRKWHTSHTEISSFADTGNWIVLTKDSDFKVSHFTARKPKKVVRIILGNISYDELEAIFNLHFEALAKVFKKEIFYVEVGKERIEVFAN